MATRLPPKAMAKKLVRLLRPQYPDAHYLKKVFQHTRMLLDVPPSLQPKRLPELLTEGELVALYETIWQARQLTHVIMLKLLLFTGVRNAELVHLRLTDVNLATCQLRITQGKGAKDRYVLFPTSFRRVFEASSPNISSASRCRGRPISLSRSGTSPSRHGAYGRLSNSTPRRRALRSGSIRISSATNSSPISRNKESLVRSSSCSVGIRRNRVWPSIER